MCPQETGGPFPADGSNGRNVLVQTGIVRSDITGSFGGPKGVAKGVPTTHRAHPARPRRRQDEAVEGRGDLRVALRLQGPLLDVRPALWRTRTTCADCRWPTRKGRVTFRSIFPAAYGGRWPHIHFEVFESEESATKTRGLLRTSQIALPEKACRQVYDDRGLRDSAGRTSSSRSLKSDIVFRDGYELQMAKVTGSVDDGMRIALTIPV